MGCIIFGIQVSIVATRNTKCNIIAVWDNGSKLETVQDNRIFLISPLREDLEKAIYFI